MYSNPNQLAAIAPTGAPCHSTHNKARCPKETRHLQFPKQGHKRHCWPSLENRQVCNCCQEIAWQSIAAQPFGLLPNLNWKQGKSKTHKQAPRFGRITWGLGEKNQRSSPHPRAQCAQPGGLCLAAAPLASHILISVTIRVGAILPGVGDVGGRRVFLDSEAPGDVIPAQRGSVAVSSWRCLGAA